MCRKPFGSGGKRVITDPFVALRCASRSHGCTCGFPPGLCRLARKPSWNMASGPVGCVGAASAFFAGFLASFGSAFFFGAALRGPKRSVSVASTAVLMSTALAHRMDGSLRTAPITADILGQPPTDASSSACASMYAVTAARHCSGVTTTPTPHWVSKSASSIGSCVATYCTAVWIWSVVFRSPLTTRFTTYSRAAGARSAPLDAATTTAELVLASRFASSRRSAWITCSSERAYLAFLTVSCAR